MQINAVRQLYVHRELAMNDRSLRVKLQLHQQ
jgi:hypothetical protein